SLEGPSHRPVDGFASNFGRTILEAADLVATGTISSKVEKRGGLYFRQFVLSEALWGESELHSLRVSYQDPALFDACGPSIAMALYRLSQSDVFQPVGKPLDTRDTGALSAVKTYIKADSSFGSIHERARVIKDTLLAQLLEGGTAARYASVEMIFLVNFQPQVFSRADYQLVQRFIPKAEKNTAKDLKLAMRHLVARVLKREAQVKLLYSAGNAQEEVQAHALLDEYFKAHPGAFTREDVDRFAMISGSLSQAAATAMLRLQASVDLRVAEREAALAAYYENRPEGLRAVGSAGSLRDEEWQSRPSLALGGLETIPNRGSE
ncbi:MAG: hypothetical protein KDB07_09960, partial [Planctomycetes bacterium]|nr:hypothetical protein [Planctomycetota bacterium]